MEDRAKARTNKMELKAGIRESYRQIVHSLGFLPSFIAFWFAVAAILFTYSDFSGFDRPLVKAIPFLKFTDPITARTILSTLTGGILSLIVFSFTMVMLLLAQAASIYSPKILDEIVKEKAHQIVLGFHIGTIIYCLILLMYISEGERRMYVPGPGVFAGVILGIVNLFMFIYFIDYVAKSVKPHVIVEKIYRATKKELEEEKEKQKKQKTDFIDKEEISESDWYTFNSKQSGYLQNINSEKLVSIGRENDIIIKVEERLGNYVLKGTPLFSINKNSGKVNDIENQIDGEFYFHTGEEISEYFLYGFRQLMEIAVKALSPGINDPGTAKLCINSLSDLILQKVEIKNASAFEDDEHNTRLIIKPVRIKDIIQICFEPIVHYGRKDKSILLEILLSIKQLAYVDRNTNHYNITLNNLLSAIIEIVNIENYIASDKKIIFNTINSLSSIPDYFHSDSAYKI